MTEAILVPYRFSGVNPHGQPCHGRFSVADGRIDALVDQWFRLGWRSLRVAAGPGPVPPPLGAELIAAIEKHPDTGRRTWWAGVEAIKEASK